MTDATKSPNHPTQYDKVTGDDEDGHKADMRKVDDILELLRAPLQAERGHKVEEEKLGCYTRHRTEGKDEKELDIPLSPQIKFNVASSPKMNSRASVPSSSRVRHRRSATSLGFVSTAPPMKRNQPIVRRREVAKENEYFNSRLKLASKKKKPRTSASTTTSRHNRAASMAGRIETTSNLLPKVSSSSSVVQVLHSNDSILPPNLVNELQNTTPSPRRRSRRLTKALLACYDGAANVYDEAADCYDGSAKIVDTACNATAGFPASSSSALPTHSCGTKTLFACGTTPTSNSSQSTKSSSDDSSLDKYGPDSPFARPPDCPPDSPLVPPPDFLRAINQTNSFNRNSKILERRPSLGQKIESKPSLFERLKIFEYARFRRSVAEGTSTVWGFFNTFSYLAGIRKDIEFTKIISERRKSRGPTPQDLENQVISPTAKTLHNVPLTPNNINPSPVISPTEDAYFGDVLSPNNNRHVTMNDEVTAYSPENNWNPEASSSSSPLSPRRKSRMSTSEVIKQNGSWGATTCELYNHTAYFTYAIMFVCTVMLIVEFGFNGWKMEPFEVNPMLGPSASTLITLGALDANLIAQDGQWWRFVTPWFLSGGIIHWLLNMVSMIILGRMLERAHGSVKVAAIWCIAALCGTVTSALFLMPSVGASGGIFGMVGAVFADIYMNWYVLYDPTIMPGESRSKWMSVTILVVEAVFLIITGLTPFIDNYAHLGGFFGGLFASCSLLTKIDYVGFFHKEHMCCSCWGAFQRRARWVWVCIPVAYCVIGIILVYALDGTYSVCENWFCRSLSCVSFPPSDPWWICTYKTGKEIKCDASAPGTMTIDGVTGFFDTWEMTCPNGRNIKGTFAPTQIDSMVEGGLQKASELVHGEYCIKDCF